MNPDLNLHYAVKDARDIIHFFSNDKRFANVFVDSLFNTNVTTSSVSDLRKKLQRAKRDDMVIVFFAGHGLLDENLDFRFATWGVDLISRYRKTPRRDQANQQASPDGCLSFGVD
jgi:hypothetical protein